MERGFSHLRTFDVRKSSTHVPTPPNIVALGEVAYDNMFGNVCRFINMYRLTFRICARRIGTNHTDMLQQSLFVSLCPSIGGSTRGAQGAYAPRWLENASPERGLRELPARSCTSISL